MKGIGLNAHVFLLVALLAGLGIAIGCNDSGGSLAADGSGPAAANATTPAAAAQTNLKLGGKWTGSASVLGDNDAGGFAITATVTQKGNAITIRTSLPTLGANFSGMIEEDGNLRLTDAFDGETWTTHFQKPTNNRIQIADFVRPPSFENPDPPTNVIDLSR